jgi:hypothetical protein
LAGLAGGAEGRGRERVICPRLCAILHVLNNLPYPDKDPEVVVPPDPLILGPVSKMFPTRGQWIFDVVRA